MSPAGIIGIAASVFTAGALLPQLFKILKEKKAEGISIGMLLVLLAGLICWIVYGCLKTDWIIILSNAVSLVINVATGILTLKYKNKKR